MLDCIQKKCFMKTPFFHSQKLHLLFVLLLLFANSVYGQLTIDFTFAPDNACSGTLVSFDTLYVSGGSNNPEKYLYDWDFGDGSLHSFNAKPSHPFDNAIGCGDFIYTVIFTVVDTSFRPPISGSTAYQVTVKARPNPQINPPGPFDNCGNASQENPEFVISFTNITDNYSCIQSDIDSIDWEGNGEYDTAFQAFNETITHVYEELGGYFLTIKAVGDNGCVGVSKFEVKNDIANPSGAFGIPGTYTNTCAPLTYTFKVNYYEPNSITTTYVFDFDDDNTEIWTQQMVSNSGGFIDHLYETSSCTNPEGKFHPSVSIRNSCDTTTIEANTVKIGIGPDANNDTATLNVCVDSVLYFYSSDLFIPGYNSNCASNHQFEWYFEEGQQSFFENPFHIYDLQGEYAGWVRIENECGFDSAHFMVRVVPNPVASAEASTLIDCKPFEVSFINNSSGDPTSFFWTVSPGTGVSFVNSTTETSYEPTIKFETKGEYVVTLRAANGCSESYQTFSITAMDVPEITLDQLPEPNCVEFSFFPIDYVTFNPSYNGITSYSWHFENGVPETSTNADPGVIIYSVEGKHEITVSAENECGWSEIAVDSIVIIIEPEITDFIFSDSTIILDTLLCKSDNPFRFGVIINDDAYEFPNLTWTSVPLGFITIDGWFTPDTPQLYTISLEYGEPPDCYDSTGFQIELVDLPEVDAGENVSICDGGDAQIELLGTPLGGTWDFPVANVIGTTYNGLFAITGVAPGIYTLNYHYKDEDTGCWGEDEVDVYIDSIPDTDFISSPLAPYCEGETVVFSAPNSNLSSTTYLWRINGGQQIGFSEISVDFTVAGDYTIELTAISPFSDCSETTTKTFTVYPIPPKPDFTISPTFGCGPLEAAIVVDESFHDFGGNSDWYNDGVWFSDGIPPFTSILHYPSGTEVEQYKVKWVLGNVCGIDSITKIVTVLPGPTSKISIDNSNTYGSQVAFVNESWDYSCCTWILPGGIPFNSCNDQVVTFEEKGEYEIQLITTNDQGCADTAEISYEFIPKGLYLPNAFIPGSPDTLVNKFRAVGVNLLSYNLAVYDTWGNLIWETSRIVDTQPADGWDGKDKKGTDLPQDVYIWYARAVFTDQTIWQGMDGNTSGNVTLLR